MQTLLGTGDVETVGPKGWQEHVSQERLLGEKCHGGWPGSEVTARVSPTKETVCTHSWNQPRIPARLDWQFSNSILSAVGRIHCHGQY